MTLGTPRATCWARGGICVRINECRSLNFDPAVPGCARGYKVCCRVHKFGSPTVGSVRKGPEIVVLPSNIDALDQDIVKEVATVNKNILKLFIKSK
ncbi:hypothetical protein evm_000835 [Chilo suppressalis]|nr:hypothetical protein evm_000835 [Chilo suppressalis]